MNPVALENFKADLRSIMGFTTLGGVRYPNLVLAQRHAHEWQTERGPSTGEERGGSSSPVEVSERVEDRKVAIQAARDAQALVELHAGFNQELVLAGYKGAPTIELVKVAEKLAKVVNRCIQTVDATTVNALPGCKTCRRSVTINGEKIGDHYADVWDKRPAPGLCYRCYEARNRYGEVPPVMWTHLLHKESRDKADRWLARNHPDMYAKALLKAKRSEPTADRPCGGSVWANGEELLCARPFMHEGQCDVEAVTPA